MLPVRSDLMIGCFLAFLVKACFAEAPSYTMSTLAVDIAYSYPMGLFYNASANSLITAEHGSVKKISVVKNGVKTYLPEPPGGFSFAAGLWVDPWNNIFVSDYSGNKVWKMTPAGQYSLVVGGGTQSGDGGPASLASITNPVLIAGDTSGNVYIPECGGHRIRKVTVSTSLISTVAGNGATGTSGDGGPAIAANVVAPYGVTVANNGDVFIVGGNDGNAGRLRWVKASDNKIYTLAGKSGGTTAPTEGMLAVNAVLNKPAGLWLDYVGNIFLNEQSGGNVLVLYKGENYQNIYRLNSVAGAIPTAVGVFGDNLSGKVYVAQVGGTNSVKVFTNPNYVATPVVTSTASPTETTTTVPSLVPSTTPTTQPSKVPSVAPSSVPTITPSAAPTISPSVEPTSPPTIAPSTATPSQSPTFAPPEYTVLVSAKSFKYFEVKVFTEANERVYPVSHNLVDCPENADAVIWGHASTPITEDTNTCVYGLPRHYWCECPALVNGNKPKLILNFGGTVFDRLELLILDWEDGEVTVSDSANNIVLFSASRAGGPLVGEEFVGYDHLNLLQIAPSVVPTMVPSSVPTTKPSWIPTTKPSIPSIVPTQTPTVVPTTTKPSAEPSVSPSIVPSAAPSFTAQYTITLTAKTFKYFEVRVYTHDNLRIFPVSYELEHCPENAGVAVWNDQTTEDTNTCVYGYPRNFWCQCSAVADVKPKLVLHMGYTVFDRVELLLLNWEDGEVTVTDEANHETFLSATHDGVGNEFVTYGNLNLEHAAAPVRRFLRGSVSDLS